MKPDITKTKKWTYEEYYKLDDDKRYEVLGGELIMAPAPYSDHQEISFNLVILFESARKDNPGKIFYAPIDVIFDDNNVIQPDILFIKKENLFIRKKRGVFGSPDLVVEILSPSSIKRDRYEKKEIYRKFGVKEYWIVDPANLSIEVFLLENEEYKLHSMATENGEIKSYILEGLVIEVEAVFPDEIND